MSLESSDEETGTAIHGTLSSTAGTSTVGGSAIASLVERILGDKQLYLDHDEYTKLLQDHGSPSESGPAKCPNKVFELKGHRYKNIWKLADILMKLYAVKKWHGAPKNTSNMRRYIATFVVTHRNPVMKGDINSLVHSKELMAISQACNSENDTTFYYLDQKSVLRWAYSKWGMENIAELKKPRVNDRLRLIGLCLHEEFREHIGLLTGLSQNRTQLDDPGYSKDALFAEMTIKFNDSEFIVSHPTNWKNAEDELSSYALLDPNAVEVFRVLRDHSDLDKIFKTTMQPYKDAMKKWVKETGAGSGEEVRFVTWDETTSWLEVSDTRFQHFDRNRGEWLTWVYMLDKQFENVLWSKYGTMRGIAARGDTGDSGGKTVGSDFKPSGNDKELVNLVKANIANGKNAMDRIARVLESASSRRVREAEGPALDSVHEASAATSVVSRLTASPLSVSVQRPLDQIVTEKMAAISSLKRDKEDAEKNETDEKIKKMRIDIANRTMWTLYQEINKASDVANDTLN